MLAQPRRLSAMLFLTAWVLLPHSTAAQEDNEPLFQQLAQQFQRPYLSLGVLLQTVADFQFDRSFPGNNGFSVANFRLALFGELDDGFGYFLQTNFAGSPSILDAYLTYDVSPAVRFIVGQQKAPFSAEFLTSAASIDFVNRAQAVTALAAGRQLGGQIRIAKPDGMVGVSGGVFNGNGTTPNGNDNDDLLYVGRVFFEPSVGDNPDNRAQIAVNIGHSEDSGVRVPGVTTSFSGSRTLIGLDARVNVGRELIAGEVIFASLDPTAGTQRDPWGFHATLGHSFTSKVQGLIRWDRFDADGITGARNLLIGGFNAWPTQATEFQINYIVDTDDTAVDHHQILVNFQFNF